MFKYLQLRRALGGNIESKCYSVGWYKIAIIKGSSLPLILRSKLVNNAVFGNNMRGQHNLAEVSKINWLK